MSRALIDRGDTGAAWRLHDLLKEQVKEAEARALMIGALTSDGRLADPCWPRGTLRTSP
ncbi:hypothetical protein [Streptomyces sp. NPDC001530]|uniref:hypothetical protein n=1 Tax=Streptomyces sp. NPDC001530 TaxID=3364582 RepID=UPI003696A6C4